MKQLLCTLALFSTLPAQADLTLHGHSMVWAMAMEGTGKETLQITKTRMRRDLIDRGRAYTQIIDLDRHEVTLIDHAMRSAEVRAIASLSRQAERQLPGSVNVTDKNLRFELKATGAKRRLQDWTCGENRLLVSTPAEVGGEKVEFELSGTAWIARHVPEQAEIEEYAKALQSPGLSPDIPALGRSPEQTRALTEALRRIAPKGLLCGLEVDLRYVGQGRVAELSKKLSSRIALEVESYDRKPIPATTFDIPKGYLTTRR